MESKEAASHLISEASPGSFTCSSFPYSDSVETAFLSDPAVDLIEYNGDNSRTDSKSIVSEDEGYVSGYEEFESELNKPVLGWTVGEENSDDLVKIRSLPISEVIVNGEDVLEKGDKGIEVDDEVNVGLGLDDSKEAMTESIDSIEKMSMIFHEGVVEGGEIVVSEDGNEVVVEVEMKGEGKNKFLSVGDEVSEPEALEEVIDTGDDVESMPEEDSIIDTIKVDVAAPGVAIVGGTEENGCFLHKPAEEVVTEVAVVEPEKISVAAHGDVELTSEGDAVVDTIQVDMVGPGVSVVGEAEENGGEMIEKEGVMVDVVETNPFQPVLDVVEDENDENTCGDAISSTARNDSIDKSGNLDTEDGVKKSEVELEATENCITAKIHTDGVVDEISESERDANQLDISSGEQADVHAQNIELTDGLSEESKCVPDFQEIKEVSEPGALEEVIDTGDDVESMPEEDSIIDTIKVDVAVPGVAIVGGTEENGGFLHKPVEEVVTEVAVVEPEKIRVAAHGDVKLTSEGDAVVDTIQVGPGVAVVGEAEENGCEMIEKEGVMVDVIETNPFQPLLDVVGDENDENTCGDAISATTSNDSVDKSGNLDMEDGVKKSEVESEAIENCITAKIHTDGMVDEISGSKRDANQLDISNGEQADVHAQNSELTDGVFEESKCVPDFQEIKEGKHDLDGVNPEESDENTDGMVFGSSEAAKKFIEELERESGGDSRTHALEQSRDIDGQIVTDSEEEGEETDDDEGDGKELFDSAALAALLKAATGGDSNGGSITITSQDGSQLFSVERPAGLGSSLQTLRPAPRSNLNRPSLFSTLTPAGGEESEGSLTEEEKMKLEKLQQIRVKFLRLVHRLGLSPEEAVAAQVLYRLAVLGGRQNTQVFNLDAAKRMALQLEAEEKDDLEFSVNMLVLGKSGVGKSATINSVLGEEKAPIDAFETGTAYVKEISGFVDGVEVRVADTPGLRSSMVEQGVNRRILSSVKKFTKKTPPDVVLYVDRLDAQSRDLNDLPLLKTVTSVLGSSIWRSAIVTLTHSASAPPDGPSGTPLSYEVFVSQRSHIVQQSIGHAVGDLRMMTPSLMNPISLVENHLSCRRNRDGHKILPNGQIWRPQLLLLCYSMKILSEAGSLSKPQDQIDHRKLFGFRARAPPLPYMLSSMLQSRAHPKLPSDQGGENGDSDIDLDDFSGSDQEEEDEYDQLPPFKPLRKAQIEKLSIEQRKAYFEEYDYRVKLLQKKQWKDELKRMREFRKRGINNNNNATDNGFLDDDPDSGSAAPIAVPLPDMALPPSFDGDNPAYRYRFLEPSSQFLARPVLDTHGWDHDCGYDGVNFEHSLAIFNRLPAVYTVQITKDKKDFTISLDSSMAAKYGENVSSMVGFDVQNMGKQLAYIFRGEVKIKNLKKNKATGGISFTILGENVVPALKIEDQIRFGKQYTLVGSAGAVRSQQETTYGANFELQRREVDYPIGQVQSTLSMSVIKWRGDLALGLNGLVQFALGRNSKVIVRAGINNKMSGQFTVRTSSSEHLSLALAAVIPTVLSVYKKLFPAAGERYSIF
ncbi:hypothetical protein OROGR_019294 [Orobanche gracilis]